MNNNNIYLTAIGLSPGGSGILEDSGDGWAEVFYISNLCIQ
jgi:hypothetical protein